MNGGDYVLLTSTNHLKYPNHSINPNVVLTNSICQGTFLDRSLLSTAGLPLALSAISLVNNFVFLISIYKRFVCSLVLRVPSLASLTLFSRVDVRAPNRFKVANGSNTMS